MPRRPERNRNSWRKFFKGAGDEHRTRHHRIRCGGGVLLAGIGSLQRAVQRRAPRGTVIARGMSRRSALGRFCINAPTRAQFVRHTTRTLLLISVTPDVHAVYCRSSLLLLIRCASSSVSRSCYRPSSESSPPTRSLDETATRSIDRQFENLF